MPEPNARVFKDNATLNRAVAEQFTRAVAWWLDAGAALHLPEINVAGQES